MNHKERVMCAVGRRPTDRLPTQITFTPDMAHRVADHLGVAEEALPVVLDNHLRMVAPDDTVRVDRAQGIRYDNWGIGWDMHLAEGFWIRHRPLEGVRSLASFTPPDPNDDRLYRSARERIRTYGDACFVLSDQGFCLFERAHCLRGFDTLLIDLLRRRAFAEELLDKITEYQVSVARNFVELGVDGGYTGDDFGQQRGPLISPDLWREVFKPRYRRIWGVFKDAGKPVFHHSCGDVRKLLGDMVELGLDVLNPVQPQAMPIEELVDQYGHRLSFWGGISTQTTLPFGSPEEVTREVRRVVGVLGKYGGYIAGPSHDMTTDVPMENFDALRQALKACRGAHP